MLSGNEGSRHDVRGGGGLSYLPSVNTGLDGGGTYTRQTLEPSIQDYENVFGPAARDIKEDPQRHKRVGRRHLPEILKGPNQFLTDRVDGLITDATNSPFTTKILPYKYVEQPDGKFQWNVWSFDEGMASRVPYESAARVLTQSNRSFAGYMVRQGMAIVLEHNFMMKPEGRENFRNQLTQLVGSIQYTNDLDVHIALVQAPSYEKHMREKYYADDKTPMQVCREYVDLFGFMQKNNNALDILIEESKARLKSWGGPMPDFLLCNSKLTFQLTMTPEKTNWVTNGYDGQKRLKTGPDIPSYRGINIIHSRSFSMESGAAPRDILRRKVRVAEYYRIFPHRDNHKRDFIFYNEERDTWFSYSFEELIRMAIADSHYEQDSTNNQRNLRTAVGLRDEEGGEGGDGLARKKSGRSVSFGGGTTGSSDQKLTGGLVQQYSNPQKHPSLAGSAQEAHLGLSLEGNTYSKAEVIKFCAAEALVTGNWELGGTFVTNDCIFAFGAVNWGKFIAKYTGSASDRLNAGDNAYIFPECYYFGKRYETDQTCRTSGEAYGQEEHLEMKTFLKNHSRTSNGFSDMFKVLTQSNYAQVIASRIQHALLFEAICDYPRLIGDFNSINVGFEGPLNQIFGDATNDSVYVKSIRFRNWMRYGFSPLLCYDQKGLDDIRSKEQTISKWNGSSGSKSPVFKLTGDFDSPGYKNTIFNEIKDDGTAFLRDAGAFLSPNHFKCDANSCETFALWCGANLILPKEFIDMLLSCKEKSQIDRRKLIHPGCLLLDFFSGSTLDTVKAEFARVLQGVQAKIGSLQAMSRIDLADMFYKELGNSLQQTVTTSGYINAHTLKDFIWTWPDETYYDNTTSSIDEMWCHGAQDVRLYGITNIVDTFPSFQVGLKAIMHWKQNLMNNIAVSATTAPMAYKVFAGTGFEQKDDNTPRMKQAFVSNWKFSKPISVDSTLPMGNVDEFLSQLLCRFMYDQSEPLYQQSSEIADMLKIGVPVGPISKSKRNKPTYDRLGGIYEGSLKGVDARTLQQARAQTLGVVVRGGKADDKSVESSTTTAGAPPITESITYPVAKNPMLENIEIVIVRPNIEHQMLGIIMGQGGEGLGNTLWGQTELSCYDDSMHGIWGMSYKYHERAIVFNEKNLVRLWDVAYDGYTGGKDATFVNWDNTAEFMTRTGDIASNYRGPSMMVMAFYHDSKDNIPERNWPSPVVFHDKYNYTAARRGEQMNPPQNGDWSDWPLVTDPSNSRIVNFKDMRVFNNPMYAGYEFYRDRMPDFTDLHSTRKPAGISTVENETFCDALAFQGTMKVVDSATGNEVEHIQGSGHHGPDWVGVASVRAGKGYKAMSGAPALHRLI